MTDDTAPSHAPTRGLYGQITHTDLASTDAPATRAWCETVFGWTFQAPMPMPGGEYHLFAYSEAGGGGIGLAGPEGPRSTPFVHVEDAQASFDAALAAGATPVQAPTRIMDGVTLAVVQAPGGVVIGISGP